MAQRSTCNIERSCSVKYRHRSDRYHTGDDERRKGFDTSG